MFYWIVLITFFVSQPLFATEPTEPAVKSPTPVTVEKAKKKRSEFSWKGDFRFAFRIARQRTRSADNTGGFEVSKLNLRLRYRIQKRITFRARYQINPVESELREAYVNIRNFGSWETITLGLQKRFYALESDLETDSLNKIAFYKLRDVAATGHLHINSHWYWNISLANGGRLNTKDISPRRRVKQDVIIADTMDENQAVGSSSREIITGIGYVAVQPSFHLNVLAFGSVMPVSDDDAEEFSTLSDVPGDTGVNEGNTLYQKLGINVSASSGNFSSQNQLVRAQTRKFQRTLFATEMAYSLSPSWKPILAYSQQTLNIDPDPLYPLSWKRQRLTLAARYRWKKQSTIAFELTLNEEDTGGKAITNDEALLVWKFKFR